MSDEKTVTEREAVLRERKAFERGAKAMFEIEWRVRETYDAHNNARALYPLPVRRRPIRVTLSDGTKWSYECGQLWRQYITPMAVMGSQRMTPITQILSADDFRQIARMLDGEMEDAPEDE